MSDKAVIDNFVGVWESNGDSDNPDPALSQWFPQPGVLLAVSRHQDADGYYAKVQVLDSGEALAHANEIAAARYTVSGATLISDSIEISAELRLTERLEIVSGSVMRHTVDFSNDVCGLWDCDRH